MSQSDSLGTGSSTARRVSVDALRGFDMFWIIGADALVQGLRPVSQSRWVQGLADQLEHVAWEGFRFYDLVFPLFVFLVGVSSVFSLQRVAAQSGKAAAYRRLVRRAAVLYLLGIFYYGGLRPDGGQEMFRYVGVLQRIAICYLLGGLALLNLRPRGLLILSAAVLLGYWALLAWVPVPGLSAASYEEGKNQANYIDRVYLPGFKYDGDWDPEGILSTLPAVVTAILGMLAGMILQDAKQTPWRRVAWLAAAGFACLAVGWLWSYQFPVIKKLWTSSYVLVAGGWSFLLLALFYGLIDVLHFDGWAKPFIWIGMNSITIYLLTNLIDFSGLIRRVIHEPLLIAIAPWGDLLVSLLALAAAVAVCYGLYRRRIFLRV